MIQAPSERDLRELLGGIRRDARRPTQRAARFSALRFELADQGVGLVVDGREDLVGVLSRSAWSGLRSRDALRPSRSASRLGIMGTLVLLIRDSQFVALAAGAAELFVHTTARTVEQRWPVECQRLGQTGVLDAIRRAVRRSERYGFEEPEHIVTYVEVMFALGDPDFDRSMPWARAILEDPDLAGSRKAIELADALAEELSSREAQQEEAAADEARETSDAS
jgi:hypothetical protein